MVRSVCNSHSFQLKRMRNINRVRLVKVIAFKRRGAPTPQGSNIANKKYPLRANCPAGDGKQVAKYEVLSIAGGQYFT